MTRLAYSERQVVKEVVDQYRHKMLDDQSMRRSLESHGFSRDEANLHIDLLHATDV